MRKQRRILWCRLGLGASVLVLYTAAAGAQQPGPEGNDAAQAASSDQVSQDWSQLLQQTIPSAEVAPVLTAPQAPASTRAADGFLDHFFFEDRSEYWRTETTFTGNPTATGVIDAAPGTLTNPAGIPDPSVFQPNNNELHNFMDFGTRGWLSDRINTDFSFRYRTDLTHVADGSPGLGFNNTYLGSHLFEPLSGYIEINGRPTDGFFANSSLRLGRLNAYGAEWASLDGLSLTVNRPKYSWTLFGGRRFTFFSNPQQRAVAGGSLILRFSDDSSLEYDTLYYITGTNSLRYQRRLKRDWLLEAYYKMVGSYPVDASGAAIWSQPNGKATVSLNFFKKITSRDYFYDYTLNARDLDPHNPLLRLYLGPFSPYTQFAVSAQRTLNSRVQFTGGVLVRRLDHSRDQGPFDASFQDYRAHLRLLPWRSLETLLEYHEIDSDRKSPFPSTQFDDISAAGETKLRDLSLEVGRSFAEGKVTLEGGGFYRFLDFQDRFVFVPNTLDKGLLGSVQVKLDQRTRLYADYSLDTDFFIFRPDIQHAQVLRLGMGWRY